MKVIALLVSAIFTLSSTNIWAASIDRSTNVQIETDRKFSSENAGRTGVIVKDVLDSDGNTVIKSGEEVKFDIARQRRRPLGRPGQLEFNGAEVLSVDGQLIKLRVVNDVVVGKSKRKRALGLGIGLGILMYPLFVLVVIKGESAEIAKGSVLESHPAQTYEF